MAMQTRDQPPSKPFPADISSETSKAIPGSLAVCEPIFGYASIAVSPGQSPFKVHVLNDPGRGIVNLFEMIRINKKVLRDALARPDAIASCMLFTGQTPFLKDAGDIAAGIAAFRVCTENLGIDHRIAVASENTFMEAISVVHDKLVHVLVENLPILEFMMRFDRNYTTFFIPRVAGGIDAVVKEIRPALAGLRGHLVIEAMSRQDVENVLVRNDLGGELCLIKEIRASTGNGDSRSLFVLNRA